MVLRFTGNKTYRILLNFVHILLYYRPSIKALSACSYLFWSPFLEAPGNYRAR